MQYELRIFSFFKSLIYRVLNILQVLEVIVGQAVNYLGIRNTLNAAHFSWQLVTLGRESCEICMCLECFIGDRHGACVLSIYTVAKCTVLATVNTSLEYSPPSRPVPEFFMPPKGVPSSLTNQVFTHTNPA